MVNTKTAKENIKINKRNRLRNLHFKSKMKTFLKKAIKAIEEKQDQRADLVKETLKIIDQTASKGIIKKTTAARKKSRLHKALNKTIK
ncbi:30S ribosomal protein S20 [Candidatus Margulisiibacteriota bacterium]